MTKKKSAKRDLIEWGIFLGVIAFLYLTGLHTTVFGAIQGLVLKTGIITPSIDDDSHGKAAYEFNLIDENNELVDFSSLKEQTVFMNIWATWCPPCVAEMPDINNLYNEMKGKNVAFVMLSMDDQFEKAKAFKEKKGFDFPIYQLASPLPDMFSTQSIPTTFVINPKGEIVVKKSGMAKYNTDEFKEFLLKGAPATKQ